MREPCWGFHASEIPPEAGEVVDVLGRHYRRQGGGWIHVATVDGRTEYGSWTSTERSLTELGPVRCPTAEAMLETAGMHQR